MAELHELWLPLTFWDDHTSGRDLPGGDEVKRRGSRVLVRCTDADLDELLSDARYYADPNGPDDIGDRGVLKRSAKATVEAITTYRAAAA